MKIQLSALTFALFLGTATLPAVADNADRFGISVGAFIIDRNTDTQLNSATNPGTEVDFEDDLGLKNSDTVFRVDGYYKFNEKHRLDFSVFDFSRSSSKSIDREIMFGDETFAIDTDVNVESDLTIYKLAYTYAFKRSERGYAGVTAGFYVADTALSISEPLTARAGSGDLTAPLPVIGVRGERAISDKWSLRGSAELFAIEFDDIGGSLVDAFGAVEYTINDLVSVGLGFNAVTIDIDTDQNSFNGKLDWRYSGALLFLKLDF